jgi:hypothetical protein
MKVSDYKEIATSLSKFATTREKADGPESLIGVQNKGGVLKFIAGTSRAGVSVTTTDYTSSADGSFTISARPFLQAAKVLPARSNVDILVSDKRVAIVTEGGGKIELDSTGTIKEAGFAKRPKNDVAFGSIEGADWGRLAKMFRTISAKIETPCVQYVEGVGYASVVAPGERPRYASYRFPAQCDTEGYNMAGYREFWDGLAAITVSGVLKWGKDGVIASGGGVEVFSAPYLVSRYDSDTGTAEDPREMPPIPILRATGKYDVIVTMPRRELIDIVKGQAPFDEHNRVTLKVTPNRLLVTAFGVDTGHEVPITAIGVGFRSVRADYLNGLLNSIDAKEVSLGWGSGMPVVSITSEDYSQWTILLAPVAM